MVRYLKLLPLLFLTSCGMPRIPGSSKPLDAEGNPIINAWTIAAEYLVYFGLAFVIAGILTMLFLKMIRTGGLCVIAGMSCFALAVLFNFIGEHAQVFMWVIIVLTGLAGFLYYKAVTSSMPVLEKFFGDLNHNGRIDVEDVKDV